MMSLICVSVLTFPKTIVSAHRNALIAFAQDLRLFVKNKKKGFSGRLLLNDGVSTTIL